MIRFSVLVPVVTVVFASTPFLEHVAHSQEFQLPLLDNTSGLIEKLILKDDLLFSLGRDRLSIYDVSNSSAPVQISEWIKPTEQPSPGDLGDIELVGNLAVISAHEQGFYVLDVGDPSDPLVLSNDRTLQPWRFDIVDGYLYVREFADFFHIVDVRDPSNPTLMSTLSRTPENELGLTAQPDDIDVVDGFAYIFQAAEVYTPVPGIGIIDVRDMENPVHIGSVTDSRIFRYGRDIVVRDSALYVGTEPGGNGVLVINVSDPGTPIVSGIASGITNGGGPLAISGNRLYFGGFLDNFEVFDISDPLNPTFIENISFPNARRMSVDESLVAFHNGESGRLHLADVNDPMTASLLGSVDRFFETVSIHATGNFAYCGTISPSGILIVDIGDPKALRPVSHVLSPNASDNFFNSPTNDVEVSGGLVYAAETVTGLVIYDVTDPAAPTVLGNEDASVTGLNVAISLPYAYLAADSLGLRVYDVSNPTVPDFVGSLTMLPGGAPLIATGVSVRDGIAYLGAGTDGFLIADIMDPSAPAVIGQLSLSGTEVLSIAIDGDRAYLGADTALAAVDISNPAAPTLLGLFNDGGTGFTEIAPDGDRIFAQRGVGTANDLGCYVLDARDPAAMNVIANYLSEGQGGQGLFAANRLFMTSLRSGLYSLAIPPPAPILDPSPRFFNADALTLAGTATEGSFITAGGGVLPVFDQLEPAQFGFSLDVSLRQDAVNTLSVTTMNEFGLVSLPAIATVVEGDAFPSTIETVTALTISPDPAPDVPVNGSLPFTCEATFGDSSTADVTEFVQWEEIANGELVTEGGLYVNSEAGPAQVRAFVAGVFSNVVTVDDA